MSLDVKLEGVRGILKLLRRDITQIYSIGKSVADGDSTLLQNFLAMYPSAPEIKSQYMNEFNNGLSSAIAEGNNTAFPTDDDIKLRNEVNTIFYKIVEFNNLILNKEKNISCAPVSCDNSKDVLNQSLARSRLPKIDLPKFNGKIAEWPKFKQLFESMIHENSEIPIIEKFHYLSISLIGDAHSIIAPFTISDKNYAKAWEALCQRFDNKRLLASSYIDKFIEFQSLKGPPSLNALLSFITNVGENIAALKSINIPNEADFTWLTLALRKLDPETRKQFESHSVNKEWPTFSDLMEFIYSTCKVLQLVECPDASRSSKPFKPPVKPHIMTTSITKPSSSGISPCKCTPSHLLYQCPIFRAKSPSSRKSFLKGKNVCYNCLRPDHLSNSCSSPQRCQNCNGKHHTLLHSVFERCARAPTSSSPQTTQPSCSGISAKPSEPKLIASLTGHLQVVLGTAKAFILDSNHTHIPVRMLIDCASQFSLITVDCAKKLGIPWKPCSHRPVGAGQTPLPKVKGKLQCQLISKSRLGNFFVEPLVVKNITGPLPSTPLNPVHCTQVNLELLADPEFWNPREIDFLLGADLFLRIINGTPISLDNNYEAIPTVFGLVVMGKAVNHTLLGNSLGCFCVTDSPISDEILKRFWETEETSLMVPMKPDPCEDHFVKTHYRDPSGRYVVALPFKEPPKNLETSRISAYRQYLSLEKRMDGNPLFKDKYNTFLKEYQNLGHMSLSEHPSAYVIPHHGVFKPSDPEQKIRVVFNASHRTVNGSLNDMLHIGPKLQKDITVIILNFRRHKVALTVDLVKMYRQILLKPEDRRYQHIFWRPDPANDVETYELNTVTYGVSSAPFLALRTIIQLVLDEGKPYPLASAALENDIYVDDVVSGSDSLENAQILKSQLISLLSKGHFECHKWASNSVDLIEPSEIQTESHSFSLSPKDVSTTKILGMSWDPKTDSFFYEISPISQATTKREILSIIARLFDPMGYLAPVTFKAKTILQRMWKAQLDWDEKPEESLAAEWKQFSSQLASLNQLRIPRYVFQENSKVVQMFGFCDASERGFAAALYLKTVSMCNEVKISLLKAKTKLAPLKTISIPRLELSAAHLLVKLSESIKEFRRLVTIKQTFLFTDSTIVLAWLRHSPHSLQTFVANRVSYIISNTQVTDWHHVSSQNNPADIASRGIDPSLLCKTTLWWKGPPCLHDPDWTPPILKEVSMDVPELRFNVTLVLTSKDPDLLQWIERFSSYLKMLRSLAYVQRFIHNLKHPDRKCLGPLTSADLDSALDVCIKAVQNHDFINEFSSKDGTPTSRRLQILAAFRDESGIVRVGGRLQNSDLPNETKFPIILPGKNPLVKLMIRHLHSVHYHLGYQALQALIRRRFWIFRLRQAIKFELNKCIVCFKMKARPQNPHMGNLPLSRVRPARPFSESGVDFAGPFLIKLSSRRNASVAKAYMCVFVCMSTRAVHIELVSSLTTDAFLAALDRFVARRGRPNTIYSDCGTNFIGAERRLKNLFDWFNSGDNKSQIIDHTSKNGFQWIFNPPRSPHFGGIWEAAVKSAKSHLYRVSKDRVFSFEELATLFVRIEAILNSRPLCPLQSDVSQGDVLTPGHFLIGAPLLSLPERDHTSLPINRLTRWQLISACVQHFWKRWHTEYLQTMQKRPKWYHHTRPLKVGDLIVTPDPASSPLNWNLGRITEVHPGEDGITRVVTIKDTTGLHKRSVHNLVSLSHLLEPNVAQN